MKQIYGGNRPEISYPKVGVQCVAVVAVGELERFVFGSPIAFIRMGAEQ